MFSMLASFQHVLLQSKMTAPSVMDGTVRREHLFALLDHWDQCSMALICAPAGYGKSTLVVDYLDSRAFDYGWYSLDDTDNAPVLFAHYFTAVLSRLLPTVRQPLETYLHNEKSVHLVPFVQNVLYFLSQHKVPESPCFLILDDLHALSEPSVLQALDYFIQHKPHWLKLMILTRHKPTFHLAKLTSQGRLINLDIEDLAFADDEMTLFLHQRFAELKAEDYAPLLPKMDGWIAGLQLLAISRGKLFAPDAFSGADKQIFDYLAEEVFRQLSEPMQQFLQSVAIFEQFNAELARTVSEDSQAQEHIESLEQKNLFIIPLDRERRWYRFHHLFAEYLRFQLAKLPLAKQRQLHQKACSAWAEQGYYHRAIEHAIQGEDQEQVVNILESYGQELYEKRYSPLLQRCFDFIDQQKLAQNIRLTLLKAWAAFDYERPEEVIPCLELAGHYLKGSQALDDPRIQGEMATLTALAAMVCEKIDLAEQAAEQALSLLDDIPTRNRATSLNALASVRYRRGQQDEALALYAKEQHIAEYLRSMPLLQESLYGQANVHFDRANFASVLQLTERFITDAKAVNVPHIQGIDYHYRMLANVYWQLGEFERCQHYAEQADAIERPLGEYWHFPNLLMMVRLHLSLQQPQQAHQLMQECHRLFHQYDYCSRWVVKYHELKLRFLMDEANNIGIKHWLHGQGISQSPFSWNALEEQLPSALHVIEQQRQRLIVLALMESGELALAMAWLERLMNQAADMGLMRENLEHHYVKAWGLLQMQEHEAATAEMQQLLHHCIETGLVGMFFVGSQRSLSLLRLVAQQNEETASAVVEFARRLIRRIEYQTKEGAGTSSELTKAAAALGITPKEWQVLLLLCDGLNNQQIAEQQFVAISTVKTHIKRLYQKLGVTARAEALVKGLELRQSE
jgi:LuxR family maltose regulon positive regulatory protein